MLAIAAGMDETAFVSDLKTLHAVTRCIEIIGEAARAVPDEIRDRAPDVPWAQIAGAATSSLTLMGASIRPFFGLS